VNVNIFCDFQILLVFGTGDMGLRRRNITKIPLKIDFCPLHPKKTCCLNFLRFGHGRLFYAKRIFVTCLVLSAQVFEQNNCFFGYVQIGFFQAWRQKWRQKYAITTSKDAPLEKKHVLRVDVASVVCELSQKSRRNADISASAVKRAAKPWTLPSHNLQTDELESSANPLMKQWARELCEPSNEAVSVAGSI